jgi:hypothetical protein
VGRIDFVSQHIDTRSKFPLGTTTDLAADGTGLPDSMFATNAPLSRALSEWVGFAYRSRG